MKQLNNTSSIEEKQINANIIPVLNEELTEQEIELELELGLGLEPKSTLELIANARGILAYAKVAAVEGDTPMACGLIDKVDERLEGIHERLDFVAGFIGEVQS